MTLEHDTLIILQMIECGIIPFGMPMVGTKKGIESLSEKERRKVKRKFRKQWRKALRKFRKMKLPYEFYAKQCGIGLTTDDLTSTHYFNRALLVYKMFERDVQRNRDNDIS